MRLRGRFAVLGIVVLTVLGVLLVRLWGMQVLEGQSYASQAEGNRIREVVVDAPRGRILDAKGRELVSNRPAQAVIAERSALGDAQLVARLAALLDMSVEDVKKRIDDPRLEPLRPRVVKLDVTMDIVSYLAEHESEYPGVTVETIGVRLYPQGKTMAHVLGYTGQISEKTLKADAAGDYHPGDTIGLSGAEAQFERTLRGDKGHRRFEVDASGRPRRTVAERPPLPGRDIQLTIDTTTQRAAEKALADAIADAHRDKFPKAKAGAIVAIDIKSGEILALASLPTYDPAIFLGGVSEKEWKALNSPASEFPLTDRAVMSAYAPASTFKVVTGMAGLRYGVASAGSVYDCAGTWIGMGEQWKKRCWKHSGHGEIGFRRGIVESCDTVFYEIGHAFYRRPGEQLQKFARTLGLGAKTGIDLPSEAAGRVPDAAWKSAFNKDYPEYRRWLPGDTVNISIGQGDLLATPLQMASIYAAIANNGNVVRPHVLKGVLDEKGRIVLRPTVEVTHKAAVSTAQLAIMRDALLGVTEEGTAETAFRGFGASVAGKTGTAQVAGKDDYAWFCGFAPADQPRYAVAVVVEQGGHGGSVAAPAARQVFAKLLGLPVEHVRAVDVSR